MASCDHKNLTLLPGPKPKLRCIHCHLTIKSDELNGGYCPECYENSGKKQYDFKEIEDTGSKSGGYRCDDCGMIIEMV